VRREKVILIGGLVLLIIGGRCLTLDKNDKKTEIVYLNENHYPKQELEETFRKNESTIPVDGIQAMITSHHYLAKDLIAKTFSKVNKEKIKKVILVSPDHFKQIKNRQCLILTGNLGWKTVFGDLEPISDEVEKITKNKEFCEDTNSFRGEHGIYTLVPFVKNYFPEAKILPLILKPKNNFEDFYNLGKEIANDFDKDKTMMVISSDFSHYVTESEAQLQDKQSIEILKTKDKEKIPLINNDCPQCIAFLLGYLGKKPEFNLIEKSNSFEISGENKDYVTSYVAAYYK
jgi:AmmeMemoRadiSam system protein B